MFNKSISLTCLFSCILLLLFSCTNKKKEQGIIANGKQASKKRNIVKPPASGNDTLNIAESSAVFFYPDTIQKEIMKEQTDAMFFSGNMHEYFYQMRNAHFVISKTWKDLKIIEAKNYRYVQFFLAENRKVLVDLDTIAEPFGLYVFNRNKPPLLIDMTNIETQVSFYLQP